MKSEIENDWTGHFGTATVNDIQLPVRVWHVDETHGSMIQAFLTLPPVDFPFYNVTLSTHTNRLSREVLALLSSPVERSMVAGKLSMVPVIVARNLKLYDKDGDATPEIECEELRVITGPTTSAGMVHVTCVNLTPLRFV